MSFGFLKQTEKQLKQIKFWFVTVRTEKKKLIVLRTPYLCGFGTAAAHKSKSRNSLQIIFLFARSKIKPVY
jgi:hypothetical protein